MINYENASTIVLTAHEDKELYDLAYILGQSGDKYLMEALLAVAQGVMNVNQSTGNGDVHAKNAAYDITARVLGPEEAGTTHEDETVVPYYIEHLNDWTSIMDDRNRKIQSLKPGANSLHAYGYGVWVCHRETIPTAFGDLQSIKIVMAPVEDGLYSTNTRRWITFSNECPDRQFRVTVDMTTPVEFSKLLKDTCSVLNDWQTVPEVNRRPLSELVLML